jgi:hypothetical protein
MSNRLVVGAVLAVAMVAALMGATRQAHAGVEARGLETFEPPEWPKEKAKVAPKFRAVIIGAAGGLSPDKFVLKEDGDKPVALKAESVKKYIESNDPLAMVVLIQGTETWMGNDSYKESAEDQVPGAFKAVQGALDALSKAGPSGSVGAVLTYSNTVETRQALADLAQITGDKLVGQQAYEKQHNRGFYAGLTQAKALLETAPQSRKVLVVIGSGIDDGGTNVAADLDKLSRDLPKAFEIYTLYLDVGGLDDGQGSSMMKKLGKSGDAQQASTFDDLTARAGGIVGLIGARYYVTFPGWDPKTKVSFSHDGKEHDFIVQVGEEETESKTLVTMTWKPPQPSSSSLWWLWFLVLPAILIVGIVLLVKVLGKPQEIQPPMPPVVEAPPPIAPPPAAQKTQMFNIGGGGDGFPIVGWIVPLNGPNQFQTFKLNQGLTKVGTGGAANIIVNDGFMSTEHAEIVCSPDGFTLVDKASTNGTFVNDSRIAKHELVDNDVFTLGKTNFKFKSIN